MTTTVLIQCTHGSARGVLSEGMLDHRAAKPGLDVRARSASAPSGRIDPCAIETLGNAGVDVRDGRSRSWDGFTAPESPGLRVDPPGHRPPDAATACAAHRFDEQRRFADGALGR